MFWFVMSVCWVVLVAKLRQLERWSCNFTLVVASAGSFIGGMLCGIY